MLRDWKELFDRVKAAPYSKTLNAFLDHEYQTKTIYPPRDMMFQAFRFTSPKTLKAVIIGQDPYHNPAEAMGMSFSVPIGIDPPPSLINIYKEIEELPPHIMDEISHFFRVYKQLEGKDTTVFQVKDRAFAELIVKDNIKMYKKKFAKPDAKTEYK